MLSKQRTLSIQCTISVNKVSEWLLFNAKWGFFFFLAISRCEQLYFHEMIMISTLYTYTSILSLGNWKWKSHWKILKIPLIVHKSWCTTQVRVDRTLCCPPLFFFNIDFFFSYKQHFATFYVSLYDIYTINIIKQ